MEHKTHPLTCPAGQVLFRPGQECPGFVQLRSGTIRVSITAPNGREVVLYRVKPGQVCLQTFSCLTSERSYSAEGIAESDLSGDVTTPGDFRRLMAEDPGFRADVLSAVANRFADYEQLVQDVALTGFDARLAKVLLALRTDTNQVLATHENLAAETASGRAFVSRRLAEFSRNGLVELKRGRLEILDIPGLERIISSEQ